MARMQNDVAKTKRLYDNMFKPGHFNMLTISGRSRHQLTPRIPIAVQQMLIDRCRRLHQAKGISRIVASRPV